MNRNHAPALRWSSLLLALLASALPLPTAVQPFRPHLLALVLAYWTLETPQRIGVGIAFLLGLAADVLTGTLLGEQGIRLAVFAHLVLRFRTQLRFFPLSQQAAALALLLYLDLVLAASLRLLLGNPGVTIGYLAGPIVGMLLWPWGFLLLDRLRLRQRGR